MREHFKSGIYNDIMLDNDLILMICYSKLVAVDEYLLKRGNEQVCTILDGVIDGLQTVLRNLEQK